MAVGLTYEPIATNTLSVATASVTFSSIPATYTDLVLVMNGKLSSGSFASIPLTFNGNTSSVYSRTYFYGDGNSGQSGRQIGVTSLQIPYWTSSEINMTIIDIMNYSNTTTFKTVLNRNETNATTTREVGLFSSTSAISSLTITPSGVNLASGSTFTLYGIAAA
jgi:hypothetical protein